MALFSDGTPDLPREAVADILTNVAPYRDGRLAGIEAEFYQGVERFHRTNQPVAIAS